MAPGRREEARGEQSEDQKRGDKRELTRQRGTRTAPPRRTAQRRGGGSQDEDDCGDYCAPCRGGAVATSEQRKRECSEWSGERRRARTRNGDCQDEDECGGSCAMCRGGAVRRRENQRALRGAWGECSACVGSVGREGKERIKGRGGVSYGPTTEKNL